MQSYFVDFIKKDRKSKEHEFFKNCDLITIKFRGHPIEILGAEKNFELCKLIETEISKMKTSFIGSLSEVYFFESAIVGSERYKGIQPSVSMDEYIRSYHKELLGYHKLYTGKVFRYFVIEYKASDSDKKITTKIMSKIRNIYQKFSIKTTFYNSNIDQNQASYHANYHGIPTSYELNFKSNDRIEKIEVEQKIKKPNPSMSIVNFLNYVSESTRSIYNSGAIHASKFLLQDEREYKYLREEYIILSTYILKVKSDNIKGEIRLGEEKERWDANITIGNETEIIEITQSLPIAEHETRKALAFNMHGYKGMCLKLRTKHQRGLDCFCQKTIKTINAKHDKNYPEPRVLLVGILSEFMVENPDIISLSISHIKNSTSKGEFSSIYLVLDGRSCIKIH